MTSNLIAMIRIMMAFPDRHEEMFLSGDSSVLLFCRFHHNSFLAARAVHTIKSLNESLVFDWIEVFFANQVRRLVNHEFQLMESPARASTFPLTAP